MAKVRVAATLADALAAPLRSVGAVAARTEEAMSLQADVCDMLCELALCEVVW